MKAALSTAALTAGAIILLLFGASPVTVALAQPELTKWKLETSVNQYDRGFGVYRRIGSRTDLGLIVEGRTSISDEDRNSRNEGSSYFQRSARVRDNDYFQGSLSPELRRWAARTSRLKTFWGIRGTAGYSWSDRRSEGYDLTEHGLTYQTDRSTSLMRSVGIGLLFGAEWQVSPHLGLGARLNPLQVDYSWTRRTGERWNDSSPNAYEEIDHTNGFGVNLQVTPSLVASINF